MHPRRSYSRWRLLIAAPRSGAENMARDTALQARAARTGETVFSIYSWTRPTLSFGRHQPAAGLYDMDKIRSANIDVVRRPTGGRAILHDHEVTYSVTAPVQDAAPLRETYARINRILLDGLGRLGVDVELASPRERAPAPSMRPCFETPGEGELVARGGNSWAAHSGGTKERCCSTARSWSMMTKLRFRYSRWPALERGLTRRSGRRRSMRCLAVLPTSRRSRRYCSTRCARSRMKRRPKWTRKSFAERP